MRPAVLALAATLAAGTAAAQPRAAPVAIPVEYHKLDNGLRVVLSRDPTAPTVVVAVYYDIGFRIEPRGRTGFAHLFEHMMFQGSRNLGKLEFIRLVQSNGGILNGSTRFDFTNYFEVVPAHTLQMMLWAEADRMRGLAVDQANLANQQAVVKNEVRVNVLNQPYGGFPWLVLPQLANTNWHNAHNFYGDFADLDAATLPEVQSFFHTYYAPNNAALAVVGDFDPAQAMAWVRRYFGDIPAAPHPPRPSLTEPRQTEEKRVTRTDSLAQRPALAVGYHAPPVGTPEYFAMGVLDQILAQGRDSRLYHRLVQEKGYTADVSASFNLLGNMYNINGPTLWTTWLFHDAQVPADSILAAFDQVVEPLRSTPVDQATLDLALVKVRSTLYDEMDALFGFGKADLLASFALFRDDPAFVNHLEEQFRAVTPELVRRTAQEYLRPTNRTVLIIQPRPAAGGR